MAVDKKQFNLAGAGRNGRVSGRSSEDEESKKRKSQAAKSKQVEDEVEDMDDDDDDDMLASVGKGSGNNNLLFITAGVLIVVIVVVAFIFLRGAKKEPSEPDNTINPNVNQNEVTNPPADDKVTVGVGQQSQQGTIGTQNFAGNTNWTTGDVLTNPDGFVQDIYGLTTRVDYTVLKINSVADFVSYSKYRGTWGGGLELYWLDVDYRNNHYVIQVPFQYYKELDETGIVPVKMEVLDIQGSSSDEVLNVISYMCLDEGTLQTVLKAQGRTK